MTQVLTILMIFTNIILFSGESAIASSSLSQSIQERYNVILDYDRVCPPSSLNTQSFMKSFLKIASNSGLSRLSEPLSLYIDKENCYGSDMANFFGADIQFMDRNWIHVGHASAAAAIEMLVQIRKFEQEYESKYKNLFKSLGIQLSNSNIGSANNPGMDKYFNFIRDLAKALTGEGYSGKTNVKLTVVDEQSNYMGEKKIVEVQHKKSPMHFIVAKSGSYKDVVKVLENKKYNLIKPDKK